MAPAEQNTPNGSREPRGTILEPMIECRCGCLNPIGAKQCNRCNQSFGAIRNKYGARKVEIDGYKFDSVAEAERYQELKLLQGHGAIRDLAVHPTYELQPAFRDPFTRAWVAAIHYTPDFGYWCVRSDHLVVEDTKGVVTADASVRMRWFRRLHPEIELRVVRRKGRG